MLDMNEENQYRIIIDTIIKEGRCFFYINTPKEQPDLSLTQIRGIIMGALALSIRGAKDEVSAMNDVINYLNDEFVNVDSFTDVEIKVKK